MCPNFITATEINVLTNALTCPVCTGIVPRILPASKVPHKLKQAINISPASKVISQIPGLTSADLLTLHPII